MTRHWFIIVSLSVIGCLGSCHGVRMSLLTSCDSGDKPLKEALKLMNNEGVSSLAVVDTQYNVIGNISNIDVKVNNSI